MRPIFAQRRSSEASRSGHIGDELEQPIAFLVCFPFIMLLKNPEESFEEKGKKGSRSKLWMIRSPIYSADGDPSTATNVGIHV